jgi:hypothetical protein
MRKGRPPAMASGLGFRRRAFTHVAAAANARGCDLLAGQFRAGRFIDRISHVFLFDHRAVGCHKELGTTVQIGPFHKINLINGLAIFDLGFDLVDLIPISLRANGRLHLRRQLIERDLRRDEDDLSRRLIMVHAATRDGWRGGAKQSNGSTHG